MGIWEHVLEPRDVESFSLVSKHIYALGVPFVDEHKKLKREYSFLCTNVCPSVPALLLKKILLWPRVGLYVTHLSIDDYQTRWDLPDDVIDEQLYFYHAPYSEDDMKLFIEAICRASSVPPEEVEYWIRTIKEGDEDPILALLLLLFPNLCPITLLIDSDLSYQLPETFRRISETENSPFLMRLTTVNLNFMLYMDDYTMDWIYTCQMHRSYPNPRSTGIQVVLRTWQFYS